MAASHRDGLRRRALRINFDAFVEPLAIAQNQGVARLQLFGHRVDVPRVFRVISLDIGVGRGRDFWSGGRLRRLVLRRLVLAPSRFAPGTKARRRPSATETPP